MTTSAPPVVGSESPRLFTRPARPLTPQTTRGFEAIAFAQDVLDLSLMPWQRWALLHGLELAEDGTFRFRTLLILCARQQGKTTLMQVLALWRLYVDRAPLVIGTAQNLDMAEETWDGAVSMAEGVEDLAGELDTVSRVNGNKFMRLTSGERYKVTTASRRGGRGLSSDLVLLDELREHTTWDAWSAVTKTTMARPSPQVLGFSNAGDKKSVVLASLRNKALAGLDDPTTTLGIFEWSAPDGAATDDVEAWVAANPALGHRASVHGVRAALQTDPEDVFRTEVLCQWVESTAPTAISLDAWLALADPSATRGSKVCFGVAVGPDPNDPWTAIAVAWRQDNGNAFVTVSKRDSEDHDYRRGTAWVAPRLAELRQRWGGAVVLDEQARALSIPDAVESTGPQRAQAHNALAAAVEGGTLRHGNDAELRVAVEQATWKPQGDGRVLDRRGSKDVTPLLAAALALHGLSSATGPSDFYTL